MSLHNISEFVSTTLAYLEHTIDANKRNDNLYHAYNLMTVRGDSEISISYLEEMLEGQVSVLSSGYLSSKENLAVLDALKRSIDNKPVSQFAFDSLGNLIETRYRNGVKDLIKYKSKKAL